MTKNEVCYCGEYGGGVHTRSARCDGSKEDSKLDTLPSKERVAELLEFWSEQLEVSMRMDGARHMRGDAMRDTIAVLKQLQSTHEPPEEPSVMGGMLSQPRPPVPSGEKLIEWCVHQIQITCDALNLDPAQWLNDSTAQDDSSQPPPVAPMLHDELTALCKRFVIEAHNGDYLEDDGFHLAREVEGLTLNRCGAAQPPAPDEAVRLRQFVESAAGQCNCPDVIVDLRAALAGEWLYQQLPGWDANNPTIRPPETKGEAQ